MATYHDNLKKAAKKTNLSIQSIFDELEEQKRYAFLLNRPEIKAMAEQLGYFELARVMNPLLRSKEEIALTPVEAREKYDELLTDNIDLIDINKKQLISKAIDLGISKRRANLMSTGELLKTIISENVSKDRYIKLVQEGEDAKIENLAAKWENVEDFGRNLPDARKQYEKSLKKSGLPKDKVLATIVGLIDKTLMRIGGEESSWRESDPTYGASTMSPDHLTLDLKKNTAEFDYTGKKQVQQKKKIDDEELFNALVELVDVWEDGDGCFDAAGNKRLFCYRQGRKIVPITNEDVRDYLKKIMNDKKMGHPHYFRFWHGTNIVKEAVEKEGMPYTKAVAKASNALGHMRTDPRTGRMVPDVGATAQKSYINPEIIAKYSKGRSERNPVYKEVKKIISKESGKRTSKWDRGKIISYLRDHPQSKAWPVFL